MKELEQTAAEHLDTFAIKLMQALEKAGALAVEHAPQAQEMVLATVQLPAIVGVVRALVVMTLFLPLCVFSVRKVNATEGEEQEFWGWVCLISGVVSIVSGIALLCTNWLAIFAPEVALTKQVLEGLLS